MQNDTPEVDPKPQLRVAQILVLSLIAGMGMFAAVTIYFRETGSPPSNPGLGRTLLPVLGVLLAGTSVASFMVRTFTINQLRRRHQQGQTLNARELLQRFVTLTIARAALHEGPGLFGIVVTFLTGNLLGLAGAAVGLLLVIVVMPTRPKFDSFVRDVTGQLPGL